MTKIIICRVILGFIARRKCIGIRQISFFDYSLCIKLKQLRFDCANNFYAHSISGEIDSTASPPFFIISEYLWILGKQCEV